MKNLNWNGFKEKTLGLNEIQLKIEQNDHFIQFQIGNQK